MTPEGKEAKLREIIRQMGTLAIAFSGGVDSTYLLNVAAEELGEDVLAITAVSPTYPQRERQRSIDLAKNIGARQMLFDSGETDLPEFKSNPPDRCYFCKKELFLQVGRIAQDEGIARIADGSNVDDLQDHRPGMAALKELGVRSPLRECGMTKNDVRERSKTLGLSTWDLPSFACLASRFPYGTPITEDALKRIEQAETALYDLGFKIIRVRHHGDTARIELGRDEIDLLLKESLRTKVVSAIKNTGYKYVALDLEGYRTGSMNEVLETKGQSA